MKVQAVASELSLEITHCSGLFFSLTCNKGLWSYDPGPLSRTGSGVGGEAAWPESSVKQRITPVAFP